MYCNSTNGTDPATQFTYYKCNSTNPLPEPPPGEAVVIKSTLNGKYCRTAPNPTAPVGQQTGIVCDQDSPPTATCFSWTNNTMRVEPNNTNVTKPTDCTGCPLYVGGNETISNPEPSEY